MFVAKRKLLRTAHSRWHNRVSLCQSAFFSVMGWKFLLEKGLQSCLLNNIINNYYCDCYYDNGIVILNLMRVE